MNARVKFKDIEINGQFVFRNCCFIKHDKDHGKQSGSSALTAIDLDAEVGEVISSAHAPTHNESPESKEEESNDNPDNESEKE